MNPLVSTRISLRWPPAPAFEDTVVLVIQGRTGFFLDLRVYIPGHPLAGQIDWATAGWKKLLPSSSTGESRASFTAIIDSRQLSPSFISTPPPLSSADSSEAPATDEGTFVSMPNGDVLETGTMPNPDQPGSPVQLYEEVWRRLPLPAEVTCLVLAREDETAFWGKVAGWEVAMGVDDGQFWAIRRDQSDDGDWEEVHRVGNVTEAWPNARSVLEGEILSGRDGRKWKVIENT